MELHHPVLFSWYAGFIAVFGLLVFARTEDVKFAALGWAVFMIVFIIPFLAFDQAVRWLDKQGLNGLVTIVMLGLAGLVIMLRCIVGFLAALRHFLRGND